MIYLILTVLLTSLLFIIFKLFDKYSVQTFQAIVINYIFCVLTGLIVTPSANLTIQSEDYQWMPFAALIGFIFIIAFYLISLTAQKVSVSAASVSAKISMVIPILVSLFVFQNNSKEFTILNYLGLSIAIFAVYFSSYKESTEQKKESSKLLILLPLSVFLLSGIADVIMNYTNLNYMQESDAALFTIMLFGCSGILGLLTIGYQLIFSKVNFEVKSIIGGIALGVPNFFSIYFLVNALTAFNNDGALMYPIANMGIILCSMIAGFLVFREKLNTKNFIGIALSLIAILLISYQEILNV